MDKTSYIKELKRKRSKYAYPDQACTQAQSLNLLSSGIYTEEERFVFELIQNAVDSYNGSSVLDIRIVLTENYLIFMHNGDAFSQRDVEGLCDVGNGNKMTDTKKIGYKGIGFKSVFMHSKCVTVESGGYCFRFEKDYWDNYWDSSWPTTNLPRNFSMPWQIIPIESVRPCTIDSTGYNVVIYIKTSKLQSLHDKIEILLSTSHFLLFLRHANIKIDYIGYDNHEQIVQKQTSANIVHLFLNNVLENKWLVFTSEKVKIPETVKAIIKSDGITPLKLQGAESFDLSFAVSLNDKDQIEGLKESTVFTYLPTSISFGFPFIVNANFITDAGRQHLVKGSEWNKMIIRSIPMEFLSWMGIISREKKTYYKVLPSQIKLEDSLNKIFNNALDTAINSIAFIPSMSRGLLKAKESIMDSVGISEILTPQLLVKHINTKYDASYTEQSFIPTGGISILREYGVFVFDEGKLVELFENLNAFEGITFKKDIELLHFLYRYYDQQRENGQSMLNNILADVRFLYAEDNQLDKPKNLYFPSDYREKESIAKGAKVLHPDLFASIKQETLLIEWLHKIGLCEMNKISIITNLICKRGFITVDNAIEVGRYLFNAWKEQNGFEKISKSVLSNLNYLNQEGKLCSAEELYQGSYYFPTLDIEPNCDTRIILSNKYCPDQAETTRREWHRFFSKMGIEDNITVKKLTFYKGSEVYNYLKDYVHFAESHEYNHSNWTGGDYYMTFNYIQVKYIPYIQILHTPLELSKTIWSYILQQPIHLIREDDYIFGDTGSGYKKTAYLQDKNADHNYLGKNFLPWVVEHYQTFPSSTGMMMKSSELFRNTPVIIDLLGKYLPYLDVDCEIHESWNDILKLKSDPTLDDYLLLLSNISKDLEHAIENKERISKIYQRIVDSFSMSNPTNISKIKVWSKKSLILTQEWSFECPSKLRYITIDGFGKNNRAYIGKVENKEKILQLLSLMKVSIITEKSIKTIYTGEVEKDEIKQCLQNKVMVLALLKSGEKATKESFSKNLISIKQQLNKTHFYHCSSIKLTYGNENDTIEKVTFGCNSNFFYTGEIRLAKIDPLLTPLCNYLKIKGRERELLVTMFEDISAIREYLQEKEYDVSFIEDTKEDSSHVFTTLLNYTRDDKQYRRDTQTGYLGEIIVYEKLKELGYTPKCYSLANETDYEDIVKYKDQMYYCKSNFGRYDIEFETEAGAKVLVEVKSTTMSKESQENMPISYREISLVEEYNDNLETSYVIARVFNVYSTQPDIYIFKGHSL